MGVDEMKIKNLKVFLENFAENAKYKLKGTKTGYPGIDRTHENGMTFLEKHPVIPSVSIYMLVWKKHHMYSKNIYINNQPNTLYPYCILKTHM